MLNFSLGKLLPHFYLCLQIVESHGQDDNLVEGSAHTTNLIQGLNFPSPQTFRLFDEGQLHASDLSLELSLGPSIQSTVPDTQLTPSNIQVLEFGQRIQRDNLQLPSHTHPKNNNLMVSGSSSVQPHFYENPASKALTSSSYNKKRKSRKLSSSNSWSRRVTDEQKNLLLRLAGVGSQTIVESLESNSRKDILRDAGFSFDEIYLYSLQEQGIQRQLKTFLSVGNEPKGSSSATQSKFGRLSAYTSPLKIALLRGKKLRGNKERHKRITQVLEAELYLGQIELNYHKESDKHKFKKLAIYIIRNLPRDGANNQWKKSISKKISRYIEKCTKITFALIRLISEAYHPPLIKKQDLISAQLESLEILEHIWILTFLKQGQEINDDFSLDLAQAIRKRFQSGHHTKELDLYPIVWHLTSVYMRLKLKGISGIKWDKKNEFSKTYKEFIGIRAKLIQERTIREVDEPWRLEHVVDGKLAAIN
ncbi:hypothetical protein O181_001198 [Austropuccinia psidii MF-1]|uniref:Uncharacterized protein n=1 Tax=Austropuccinia psidii MF-1 TaxID=1389203 RepID=A0A9Q3GBH7_9BASI|nr:hypothetical protein [Austropuccinia psidii MF-1]